MKNYIKKKRITIMALVFVAVILVGGLWLYVDSMGDSDPDVVIDDNSTENADIPNVTEIKVTESTEQSTPANESEVVETEATEAETKAAGAISSVNNTNSTNSGSSSVTGGQSKTSDDKPKTPAEATPPADPPPAAQDNPDPSDPIPAVPDTTPKSGDTNNKGEIYVPGFGWIPNEGGGIEYEEAPNAGTGDILGDM